MWDLGYRRTDPVHIFIIYCITVLLWNKIYAHHHLRLLLVMLYTKICLTVVVVVVLYTELFGQVTYLHHLIRLGACEHGVMVISQHYLIIFTLELMRIITMYPVSCKKHIHHSRVLFNYMICHAYAATSRKYNTVGIVFMTKEII